MVTALVLLLLAAVPLLAAPRRYRQFDDDSLERSYYTDCPRGYVLRYDGECVRTRVQKRFFIYKSPRSEERDPEVAVLQNPNRNFNYVFVRTPDAKIRDSLVVAPPQEQTLIYLLAKNKQIHRQVVQLDDDNEKPELYHVNYGDEDENVQLPGGIDLQTALQYSGSRGSFGDSSSERYGFRSLDDYPSRESYGSNNFDVLNFGSNSYGGDNDEAGGEFGEDGLGNEFEGDLRGDIGADNELEAEGAEGALEGEDGANFGAEGDTGLEGDGEAGFEAERDAGFEAEIGQEAETEGEFGEGAGFEGEQEAGETGVENETGNGESVDAADASPAVNTARNLFPSPGLASTISIGIDGAPSAAFGGGEPTKSIAEQLGAVGKSLSAFNRIPGQLGNVGKSLFATNREVELSNARLNSIPRTEIKKIEKPVDEVSVVFSPPTVGTQVIGQVVSESGPVGKAEAEDVISSQFEILKIVEHEAPSDVELNNASLAPETQITVVDEVVSSKLDEDFTKKVEELETVSIQFAIKQPETIIINELAPETQIAVAVDDVVSLKPEPNVLKKAEEVVSNSRQTPIQPLRTIILNVETTSNTDDEFFENPGEIDSQIGIEELKTVVSNTSNTDEPLVALVKEENSADDGIALFVLDRSGTAQGEANTVKTEKTFTSLIRLTEDSKAAEQEGVAREKQLDDGSQRALSITVTNSPLSDITKMIGRPVSVPRPAAKKVTKDVTISKEGATKGAKPENTKVTVTSTEKVTSVPVETAKEQFSSDDQQSQNPTGFVDMFFERFTEKPNLTNEQIEIGAPTVKLAEGTKATTEATAVIQSIFSSRGNDGLKVGADVVVTGPAEKPTNIRKRFTSFNRWN